MIGTLPPMKGISRYCYFLASAISDLVDLEFISFKKLYPDFLYPGGTDKEQTSEKLTIKFKREDNLHGWNPVTWIKSALQCSGNIVHLQWWSIVLFPACFVLLILSKIRCKRIVVTIHNVIPHEHAKIGKILTRILINFSDAIIVHSNSNKEVLIKKYPNVKEDYVFVVPHGLLSFDEKIYDTNTAKALLGIPSNLKTVLFFGNIRPYKGLKYLIKAMSKVTRILPSTRLIIAGHSWEDWREYEQLIEKENMIDKVIIKREYINSKEAQILFAATDLVVLPYEEFDAQSGVGLMALNYCKPMLVTSVGGLPELVQDPISVVEPKNSEMLADKIVFILRDVELLSKLEKDAIRNREKYQWSKIANLTLQIYARLLN